MPTPPKESIGGFVNQVLDSELRQLESNQELLSTFMQNSESYDEDFKNYVDERSKLMERTKSEILRLQDILIKS